MVTYDVRCKYAPAKFKGKALVPTTDTIIDYTVKLTVPSERAIFPNLLKSIQKETRLMCVKIYDIQKDVII